MLKSLTYLLATGFYSGLSPKAPGTMGTLACALLVWAFWNVPPLDSQIVAILSPEFLCLISTLMGGFCISYYYFDLNIGKQSESAQPAQGTTQPVPVLPRSHCDSNGDVGICIEIVEIATTPSGSRNDNSSTNTKFDPQEIVIDEFAGYLLTLSFLPPNNISLVLAFISFRFFDILKPWPIKIFEKLPGAWGVMADDLVAGMYAGTCLFLVKTI